MKMVKLLVFFTATEDNPEYYGDEEEDELLMEVLTCQPTKEDFVRWEEKYKNSPVMG